MIMTDNDYDKAIVWCKKKIENVKKYHILRGKRLEGYEEAMLCVMSYLHCEKERSVDRTNADRIRAMSDEEMAKAIASKVYTGACNDFDIPYDGNCCHNCEKCDAIIKWLQQPVE